MSSSYQLTPVKARWNRVRNGLDDDGKCWLAWYVDEAMQPAELAAVLDALAA